MIKRTKTHKYSVGDTVTWRYMGTGVILGQTWCLYFWPAYNIKIKGIVWWRIVEGQLRKVQ